jgi:hypothetical protein
MGVEVLMQELRSTVLLVASDVTVDEEKGVDRCKHITHITLHNSTFSLKKGKPLPGGSSTLALWQA